MCAHTDAHTCTRAQLHMHTHSQTHTRKCTHMHRCTMHTHTGTHSCPCTHIRTHRHRDAHTGVHTHAHAPHTSDTQMYTHACPHTHAEAHSCTCPWPRLRGASWGAGVHREGVTLLRALVGQPLSPARAAGEVPCAVSFPRRCELTSPALSSCRQSQVGDRSAQAPPAAPPCSVAVGAEEPRWTGPSPRLLRLLAQHVSGRVFLRRTSLGPPRGKPKSGPSLTVSKAGSWLQF